MASKSDDLPMAQVRQQRVAGVAVSKLWWLTLACLIVAGYIVFQQVRPSGTAIVVRFDQGYGLHPGDPVRYRGIDVGVVESVVLSDSMDNIEAEIVLHSRADRLAREGSRFWIERPRVSLADVRGLETVVGPKYVGVQPGALEGARQVEFQGLAFPPGANEFSSDGLVVVLQSPDRFGLQTGSPVRYRGVDIGHIMSVSLAGDASLVQSRAYIRPEYRNLVRTDSKFWSNSGLDLTFGLRGFEIDADTLSTIAAGGVALATPPDSQTEVATEYRFTLHKNADPEWLQWRPNLVLEPQMLPDGNQAPNMVLGVWRRSRFSVARFGRRNGWILPLEDRRILGPADLLEPSEKGNTLEVAGQTISLVPDEVSTIGGVAFAEVGIDFVAPWATSKLRSNAEIEDVELVCGDGNSISLRKGQLTVSKESEEDAWAVDPSVSLDDSWHGAAVVAKSDGAVVGVCVISDGRPSIALMGQE